MEKLLFVSRIKVFPKKNYKSVHKKNRGCAGLMCLSLSREKRDNSDEYASRAHHIYKIERISIHEFGIIHFSLKRCRE